MDLSVSEAILLHGGWRWRGVFLGEIGRKSETIARHTGLPRPQASAGMHRCSGRVQCRRAHHDGTASGDGSASLVLLVDRTVRRLVDTIA